MKPFFILFSILILFSCKKPAQEKMTTTSEINDTIKSEMSEKENVKSEKKVELDFAKNKELLDIILLLPKEAFSSWDWDLEERTKWYNEIKANNYYIDDTPNFLDQIYFEPKKAAFSIVDGSWYINIYKTAENSFIVVTDNIVGDGNELSFYEVKSNKIEKYLNEELFFSNYKELIKNKDADEDCTEKLEALDDPIFQFDFSVNNKIEIESSWVLTKNEYGNCLIGNAILYNFNPATKKFEVEKIYWKPKKNN
jgi:hypothetical protein